jgi:hypothetical protein
MLKSKKASENWMGDTFIFIILFSVVLGMAAMLFSIYFSQKGTRQSAIYENIDQLFLEQRIKTCFYPKGEIDASEFTQERLIDCFRHSEERTASFQLTLREENKNPISISLPNWKNTPTQSHEIIISIKSQSGKTRGALQIERQ